MHIPDGFIDLKTAAATGVFSVSGFLLAILKVKQLFRSKAVVLMGVFSALIFAAQMVNFTIPGGASGHLLGAALAAIILGPYSGMIIMAAVLLVQAFAFGDGGISALGANTFNMAIAGVISAYLVYRLITGFSRSRISFYIAAAVSSWFSVVTASVFASLELASSKTFAIGPALGSMVIIHMVIGLGEAAITVAALAFVDKLRPDLILTRKKNYRAGNNGMAFAALICLAAIVIGLFLSPLASAQPDGLEKVAGDLGFAQKAANLFSPNYLMKDYTVPWVKNSYWQTGFSGLLGILLILAIFALIYGLAAYTSGRRKVRTSQAQGNNQARIKCSENMIKTGSRIDIRAKLLITVITILFIAGVPAGRYDFLIFYFLLCLLTVFFFKPPVKAFMKRLFTVFLIPFFISLFIPFSGKGAIIYELNLGIIKLNVTDISLTAFYSVMIKSFLSLMLLSSMITSTDERDIFWGMRKLRIPKIVVSIIFLMYRYIFLLREEFKTGQKAINARIFSGKGFAANKKISHLIGNLFIKSYAKAENIFMAMQARGFDGNFYLSDGSPGLNKTSIAVFSFLMLSNIAVMVLGFSGNLDFFRA